MCGRFVLLASLADIQRYLHSHSDNSEETDDSSSNAVSPQIELQYRQGYNIAPQTYLPIIAGKSQRIEVMKWGIHLGQMTIINARDDSVAKETRRSMYKHIRDQQRCLVPCQGYFEWKRSEGSGEKFPFYFFSPSSKHMKDHDMVGSLFLLAGLYMHCKPQSRKQADDVKVTEPEKATAEKEPCFAIMTTSSQAVKEIANVHDRMPVIIWRPDDIKRWLDPSLPFAKVSDIIERSATLLSCIKERPLISDSKRLMESEKLMLYSRPVSKHVSNVRNGGVECITPLKSATWTSSPIKPPTISNNNSPQLKDRKITDYFSVKPAKKKPKL